MSQTPKKREFPYTEYNKQLHEKYGNMARFIEGCAVPDDWAPDDTDEPVSLDWNGQPEVVGISGDLAGILIDEETITLIDTVQERIFETDEKYSTAFVYHFERTQDPKRDAQIMALYQRLINDLLKQQFKAAG